MSRFYGSLCSMVVIMVCVGRDQRTWQRRNRRTTSWRSGHGHSGWHLNHLCLSPRLRSSWRQDCIIVVRRVSYQLRRISDWSRSQARIQGPNNPISCFTKVAKRDEFLPLRWP